MIKETIRLAIDSIAGSNIAKEQTENAKIFERVATRGGESQARLVSTPFSALGGARIVTTEVHLKPLFVERADDVAVGSIGVMLRYTQIWSGSRSMSEFNAYLVAYASGVNWVIDNHWPGEMLPNGVRLADAKLRLDPMQDEEFAERVAAQDEIGPNLSDDVVFRYFSLVDDFYRANALLFGADHSPWPKDAIETDAS
jgi:hypothetical protein